MTLRRYTGHRPSNVSKDAKYTVKTSGEVQLVYRASDREKWLMSTADHTRLVGMVDAVKMELNGVRGGVFYINEFCHVLVPDPLGGQPYYAGHYDGALEFRFESTTISSITPADLKAGDPWPGPHAGIRYTLTAGGKDIKYEQEDGRRSTEVRLSDQVGQPPAARLAQRLARVKGDSGGRIYINERGEFFGPVATNDYASFVYLGGLGEDDPWFMVPAGFPGP